MIASTGHSSQEEVDQLVQQLQQSGALAHTTVVAAGPDATLGERYAALCTACSLGERVRDDGGHALVVLDDLRPLLQVGPGAFNHLGLALYVCSGGVVAGATVG